ncbi:LutC/YkgG family protein [Nocardia nova]|uniref:LutC/YkgG family protein n=1 Tax=Nocardia nova TaxID=37330 RepID=UPI0033C08A2F
MSSRETILARIRAANGAAPREVRVPRDYLTHAPGVDPADRAAVLDLFEQRVKHYGAEVFRTAPAEIPAAVDRVLQTVEAHSVLAPRGLPPDWTATWAQPPDHYVQSDEPPLAPRDLDTIDAVVTTCAAAIAQSGTVVLDGGPGQGRRAGTLVPDCHVCVVRADQVKSALPEVVPHLDPRRPTTWISGPSATVDIEMTRVQGVHGPRRLFVLLAG